MSELEFDVKKEEELSEEELASQRLKSLGLKDGDKQVKMLDGFFISGKKTGGAVPYELKQVTEIDSIYQSTLLRGRTHIEAPCQDKTHLYFHNWRTDEKIPFEKALQTAIVESRQHVAKCKACKIILGVSQAKVLNYAEVASLFAIGVYNKHSPDNRRFGITLQSEPRGTKKGGVLHHYSTIEAIMLADGKTIVNNNQCWSAGFAHCPHVPGAKCSLPLSSIETAVFGNNEDELVDRLQILDVSNNATLWAVTNAKPDESYRYFISGWDEGQQFMTELYESAKTVDEAFAQMKPHAVKEAERKGITVIRQGDIFLIPKIDVTDEQVIDKAHAHFEREAIIRDVEGGFRVSEIDLTNPDKYRAFDSDFYCGDRYYVPRNIPLVTYVDWGPRQLVRDPKQNLLKTRHYGTYTGVLQGFVSGVGVSMFNAQVVKGFVRHDGHEHAQVNLGKVWHIALQARQKESFKVERRSERVRAD